MKLAGASELVGSSSRLETFTASELGALFPSVHKNSLQIVAVCLVALSPVTTKQFMVLKFCLFVISTSDYGEQTKIKQTKIRVVL
jgi:hypothetical protein